MAELSDFSVTGTGFGTGSGFGGDDSGLNFQNDNLEDLLYGALKNNNNNQINILQLVLSALVFLSVVAIIQYMFIEIQNFDTLNFTSSTTTPTDSISRRKSTQLKFMIALITITIVVYVIYRFVNR